MLKSIGVDSLDQLIAETVPASIRLPKALRLPAALKEHEFLRELQSIGLDVSVAKRTKEGEVEVDLMAEVEEPKQRGLKRVGGFDIGLETAIGELTGAGGGAAVALGERDEMQEDEADSETETERETETAAPVVEEAAEEEVYLDESEAVDDEEPSMDM